MRNLLLRNQALPLIGTRFSWTLVFLNYCLITYVIEKIKAFIKFFFDSSCLRAKLLKNGGRFHILFKYKGFCLGGALWRYFQRPWIAPEDLIPNPVVSSWWLGDLLLCQELLPFYFHSFDWQREMRASLSYCEDQRWYGGQSFGEIQGERVLIRLKAAILHMEGKGTAI